VAILCEVMAGPWLGRFRCGARRGSALLRAALEALAARFFADLETADGARFYRAVGLVGRTFVEIEAEAFAMDA
jgi:hypothetical protein